MPNLGKMLKIKGVLIVAIFRHTYSFEVSRFVRGLQLSFQAEFELAVSLRTSTQRRSLSSQRHSCYWRLREVLQ
jgi:hypothetical protein